MRFLSIIPSLSLSLCLSLITPAALAQTSFHPDAIAFQQRYETQLTQFQKRLKNLNQEIKFLQKKYKDQLIVSSYGTAHGLELVKIHIPSLNKQAKKVVITAGVHGNELLAPLTAIDLAESFLNQSELKAKIELTIYPAVSPHGISALKRKVRNDIDLNRNFSESSTEPEISHLAKDLKDKRFDLALDLHGGPTKETFFTIQSADDQGLASEVFSRFPQEIFLESNDKTYPGRAGIPSDPTRYEMFARGVARSSLKGTLKSFFYDELKVPYSYTMEYPGRMEPALALQLNRKIVTEFLISISQ